MIPRLVFPSRAIALPGVVMFGRYQYAASREALPAHAHRHAIEICFLERGEQSYRVGGKVYRLTGGDQFFTLPGEVHDTANLPEERGILYWLILNFEAKGDFLGLAPAYVIRLQNALKAMPARHFRADANGARLMANAVKALVGLKEAGRNSLERGVILLQLQALLLEYLVLTIKASRLGAKGEATPLMRRVLNFIEKNPETPVEVALLAKVAQLSESRFKARFRQEVGVPPAEFWMRHKIERATEMLKSQSVTDVAYALGFSSSQYFATVFKRYTLAPPSRMRG